MSQQKRDISKHKLNQKIMRKTQVYNLAKQNAPNITEQKELKRRENLTEGQAKQLEEPERTKELL